MMLVLTLKTTQTCWKCTSFESSLMYLFLFPLALCVCVCVCVCACACVCVCVCVCRWSGQGLDCTVCVNSLNQSVLCLPDYSPED